MSVGLYLRSFCGFALQLVPCAMLLLIPFQDEAFAKGKKRAFVLLALLSLGFSLCYPVNVWWNMGLAADTNLDDNLFMLLAIVGPMLNSYGYRDIIAHRVGNAYNAQHMQVLRLESPICKDNFRFFKFFICFV